MCMYSLGEVLTGRHKCYENTEIGKKLEVKLYSYITMWWKVALRMKASSR